MSNRFPRLFREPLIQFLLIGACIYGAYALFGTADQGNVDSTLRVDASRIRGFAAQWKARWSRPPTRQELDGVIDRYVREEVLYRQAVLMGLDEDDAITRRRMAQKLEYLTSDLARLVDPTEEELEKYFEKNVAQFVAPDLVTFVQVFFDPDQRDETTLDDASQLLARLREAGVPDPGALRAGDRFMLQNYYQSASEVEVRRQMGGGFASSVMELEPGAWHGPILSGYGVHLVYVYDRLKTTPPALAQVRPRVLEAWQAEQIETFNEEFYENLKSRYEVIIENPELGPDRVLQIDPVVEEDAAAEAEPAA